MPASCTTAIQKASLSMNFYFLFFKDKPEKSKRTGQTNERGESTDRAVHMKCHYHFNLAKTAKKRLSVKMEKC